jgi:hypothetical protein
MSAATLSFTISPFAASLAEFDPSVHTEHLIQRRAVASPHEPLNFVVLFHHGPTNRMLAYDLLVNIWSDVTGLRDWNVPQPRVRSEEDLFAHMTTRLR